MSSQAQAKAPLKELRGLVFIGFPLHPAGKPSQDRAKHLAEVKIPMLFLQGTRDALAERSLLEALLTRLGPRASLCWLDEADHSFHVAARSGRNEAQVRSTLCAALYTWMEGLP